MQSFKIDPEDILEVLDQANRPIDPVDLEELQIRTLVGLIERLDAALDIAQEIAENVGAILRP